MSKSLKEQIEDARGGDEETKMSMDDGSLDDKAIQRLRYLNLWIWITKALVLREHSLFTFYSDKVKKHDSHMLDENEINFFENYFVRNNNNKKNKVNRMA